MRQILTSLLLLVIGSAPAGLASGAEKLVSPRLEASGFDGAVVFFDGETQAWHASDASWLDATAIPASTFKVFSSLVALELGLVGSLDQLMILAEYHSSREAINRPLRFDEAFRLSALPHYKQLVRVIGEQRMQAALDATGYGNRSVGGGIDQFWITGDLRISPREQLAFLQRLTQDDLPFRSEVMRDVRFIMRREEFDGGLRAKTGWATSAEGEHTGWSVGWLEREEQAPLYFAVLLQTREPGETFLDIRLDLALQALAEYTGRQI